MVIASADSHFLRQIAGHLMEVNPAACANGIDVPKLGEADLGEVILSLRRADTHQRRG